MSLTTKQIEALSIASEECAEIIQAISKIFRFGIDTKWKGETNREHLEEEIGDFIAMARILEQQGIIDMDAVSQYAEFKIAKLKTWSTIFTESA
jgi:NTP pyrophosphatase (non-canonical NTP hydrolase)